MDQVASLTATPMCYSQGLYGGPLSWETTIYLDILKNGALNYLARILNVKSV